MSQENVEIVKRVLDDYNRRDLAHYDELFTPDFELFTPMNEVEGGRPWAGREGLETFVGNIRDTWAEQRYIAAEFRDLGDRVLVLGRMVARGRSSGAPVDVPVGSLYECRDGKITRISTYLDHSEALRAAGLTE